MSENLVRPQRDKLTANTGGIDKPNQVFVGVGRPKRAKAAVLWDEGDHSDQPPNTGYSNPPELYQQPDEGSGGAQYFISEAQRDINGHILQTRARQILETGTEGDPSTPENRKRLKRTPSE